MKIRLAGIDDLETLIQLRLDYFRASELAENQTVSERMANSVEVVPVRESLKKYFQKNLGESLFVFLAEIDGETAGAAFLILFDWPPGPMAPGGRMGRAANVLTYPQYRRQGVATSLMGRLLEEAGRLGVSRIDLLATAAGEKLYRQLGFVENTDHLNLQRPLD